MPRNRIVGSFGENFPKLPAWHATVWKVLFSTEIFSSEDDHCTVLIKNQFFARSMFEKDLLRILFMMHFFLHSIEKKNQSSELIFIVISFQNNCEPNATTSIIKNGFDARSYSEVQWLFQSRMNERRSILEHESSKAIESKPIGKCLSWQTIFVITRLFAMQCVVSTFRVNTLLTLLRKLWHVTLLSSWKRVNSVKLTNVWMPKFLSIFGVGSASEKQPWRTKSTRRQLKPLHKHSLNDFQRFSNFHPNFYDFERVHKMRRSISSRKFESDALEMLIFIKVSFSGCLIFLSVSFIDKGNSRIAKINSSTSKFGSCRASAILIGKFEYLSSLERKSNMSGKTTLVE